MDGLVVLGDWLDITVPALFFFIQLFDTTYFDLLDSVCIPVIDAKTAIETASLADYHRVQL